MVKYLKNLILTLYKYIVFQCVIIADNFMFLYVAVTESKLRIALIFKKISKANNMFLALRLHF